MRAVSKWVVAVIASGLPMLMFAQDCPARPDMGTVVNDPLSLSSQNGVLNAEFTLARSVDETGYTHYCYKYKTPTSVAEAPTLRVNPGDTLNLKIVNRVKDDDALGSMEMSAAGAPV